MQPKNDSILSSIFWRVRRNHALEHATLHLLSRKNPRTSIAGQSDFGGFWIIGDVSSQDVEESVQEALQRLKNGERQLAIHPFCGTNLVASALVGGLAAMGAFFGSGKRLRDKLERLPLAVALIAVSMIFSRPLGAWLQSRVTTSSDVSQMQIRSVRPMQRGWVRAHRVSTQG